LRSIHPLASNRFKTARTVCMFSPVILASASIETPPIAIAPDKAIAASAV
jgi:hypothetical protein